MKNRLFDLEEITKFPSYITKVMKITWISFNLTKFCYKKLQNVRMPSLEREFSVILHNFIFLRFVCLEKIYKASSKCTKSYTLE